MTSELSPDKLKFTIDENKIGHESTDKITPLKSIIGQDRAVKALKFGLNIENGGFNIFVSGHTGTGRMTGVKDFVEELAKTKPAPSDWCYVNNFKNSYEPKTIELPPGKGIVFKEEMINFINSIRSSLPKTFGSKDYSEKKDTIVASIEKQKDKLLSELNEKAEKQGFTIKSTQIGLFILPAINGKPLDEKQFMTMDDKKKKEIKKKKAKVNKDLNKTMNEIRDLDRQISVETKKLNQQVAHYTIDKFVSDINDKFNDISEIIKVTPIVKTKYRPGYSYTFILETIQSFPKYISAGGQYPRAECSLPLL
ncbi:MAG: Lon-like protease helical domain-containing protein [Actinomycetota bacterium]|nr:Lon-like protease helical domain-containing protein [Actinomycetota bacterium]